MKYLFTGDTHGHKDLDKLRDLWPSMELSPRDALIHCGDFGAPWIEDSDEVLQWWRMLPVKKIICLGNHENYGWILRQPIVRRFGGRGHDLGGGIFAPLPGQVLTIGGRSFWFYPGGLSVDFFLRTPGRSLFAEELLERHVSRKALEKLQRRAPVDYVITHDAPRSHVESRFGYRIGPPPATYYKHLNLPEGSRVHPGTALEAVRPEQYRRWYYGHHHRDDSADRMQCLWQTLVLEDGITGMIREMKQ